MSLMLILIKANFSSEKKITLKDNHQLFLSVHDLAKERVAVARSLGGRIGETVSGINDVHFSFPRC